jgi:hypothetical protein
VDEGGFSGELLLAIGVHDSWSGRGVRERPVFPVPETTVPAFAGTVFIYINKKKFTSSWQPSSCRLSSLLIS